MKTWRLALALTLAAIGVFFFLMIQAPDSEAGTPPPSATYVDMYNDFNCSDCHPENWDGWSLTKHAQAYPDLMAGFNRDSCEPCHATGAGVPSIYPSTGYDPLTNLPVYLQNVTCQTCHGPASAHESASFAQKQSVIGLVLNSSLCGACHYSEQGLSGTHHPTYSEWQVSGHNTTTSLPSYVKRPACASCHEAWNIMKFLETGYTNSTVLRQPGEDAPLTWEIGCSACHDPHSMGAGGTQLRLPAETICSSCHNAGGAVPGAPPHHPMAEMRNNTAGSGIVRTGLEYMPSVNCVDCHMGSNLAGLPNHTFRPNPSSCTVCHDTMFTTNESAQAYVDMVASMTNVGIFGTEPLVEEASGLIDQMRGNRTNENLVTHEGQYEIALFNLESVVSDSSDGNHNPRLASALLDDAQIRAEIIITGLTPPDKITGVRAFRLANGTVMVEWNASDAADFAKYRVYVLSSARSNITADAATVELTNISTVSCMLTGISNGTVNYVYVTAVDSNGNEITNTVTAATVTGGLEQIIADLQQEVADLGDQVDSLQGNNTKLSDDVASLEDRLSDAQSQRTMWGVLGILVGAIVGLLLGLVLGRMKPKGTKPPEEPPPQE